MKSQLIMACVLGFSAVILVGIALVYTIVFGKQEKAHVLVLNDYSQSADVNCNAIVEQGEKAFSLPEMERGSTVTFLFTGDQTTANEPRTLGSFPVPVAEKALEGRQKTVAEQEKILQAVKTKCEQTKPAQKSAIFLGFKAGIEQLRGQGCEIKGKCRILSRTDLQENAEPQIRAALGGDVKAMQKLPAPLDNRGIKIDICGIAETRGTVTEKNKTKQLTQNRYAQQADQIREVWRKLFTEPQTVNFSAFCQ